MSMRAVNDPLLQATPNSIDANLVISDAFPSSSIRVPPSQSHQQTTRLRSILSPRIYFPRPSHGTSLPTQPHLSSRLPSPSILPQSYNSTTAHALHFLSHKYVYSGTNSLLAIYQVSDATSDSPPLLLHIRTASTYSHYNTLHRPHPTTPLSSPIQPYSTFSPSLPLFIPLSFPISLLCFPPIPCLDSLPTNSLQPTSNSFFLLLPLRRAVLTSLLFLSAHPPLVYTPLPRSPLKALRNSIKSRGSCPLRVRLFAHTHLSCSLNSLRFLSIFSFSSSRVSPPDLAQLALITHIPLSFFFFTLLHSLTSSHPSPIQSTQPHEDRKRRGQKSVGDGEKKGTMGGG